MSENISDIIELKTKSDLENISLSELLKYIKKLTYVNYYTGLLWYNMYNKDEIIDNKLTELISDEIYSSEYIVYIKLYASKSDIFLFENIEYNEYSKNEILSNFIFYKKGTDELISYDEFSELLDNITYLENESELYEYIDEFIVTYLNSGSYEFKHDYYSGFIFTYFNYESFIRDMKINDELIEINSSYIIDYN